MGWYGRLLASITTAALLFTGALPTQGAEDKSGVGPNRLKLPKGPGALEGIGENAEPNLTMGLMTYGVPIAVPTGYGSLTPSLRLSYSSGAGNSELGIGWSLSVACIERMTNKGLPRYTADDRIAANGSDELVRVDATANVFRARYEGGFVRYTWVDAAKDGARGYWKAEYPDGRIGWFGASSDGSVDDNAEVAGPKGVFRWHLVETTDPLGHSLRYEYSKDGAVSLLKRVSWVFEGATGASQGIPRYEVLLGYEARSDQLSDLKPGFLVTLTQRITALVVMVHGQQLRRYALTYGAGAAGISRLVRIQQYGLDDVGPYPVDFTFHYTDDAPANCSGACDTPELYTMGAAAPGAFNTGNADLVDMNSDGLPDVLDTTPSLAAHQIYINNWTTNRAFAPALASGIATSGFSLSSPHVQTVDLDGDGFTDLVLGIGGPQSQVLYGKGTTSGDWGGPPSLVSLPDFSSGAATTRFLDYDNDRRIDILKSDGVSTVVLRNDPAAGFVEDTSVDNLGISFATDNAQLADMNGDGMLDVARILPGVVAYKLNFGFGHFSSTWIEMVAPPGDPTTFKLVDINGDGLSDIVIVLGDSVQTALNQNGASFLPVTSLSSQNGYAIPQKTSDVAVRFADMNANGSTDVVWVDSGGNVTFLDLHPIRPNLLSRIRTGIGKVIDVTYGTAAAHMATDEKDRGPGAWRHRLPHPMQTVDAIDTWNSLSGGHQVSKFHYSNAYYDGTEKQFRGFADVTVTTPGDANIETGRVDHHFEIGESDAYRHSLDLGQDIYTRNGSALLRREAHAYGDCAVGGVPANLSPPVRTICPTQTTSTILEGQAPAQGVSTRERYTYDGYGNRTRVIKDGVIAMGSGGCTACAHPGTFGAPCDTQCLGDEQIEETDFVPPTATAGRWMIHEACEKRMFGVDGGTVHTRERYFYDGLDSALCSLSAGLRTRTEALVDASGNTVDRERLKYDANGAVIAVKDANGHSRSFTYDAASLLLLTEDIAFDDSARQSPYSLRMSAQYHAVLETVTASSHWMKVVGGSPVGAPRWTAYGFDEFGRLTAIARPGDSLTAPTEQYRYVLADPVSMIVKHARGQRGGNVDTEETQCFDGLGRKFQTRSMIGPGSYQVTGYAQFDAQGDEYRTYQPWRSTLSTCETTPPEATKYTESTFDATKRPTRMTLADAVLYGGSASFTTTTYAPLTTTVADADDNDPSNKLAYATPTVTTVDGLGRTVLIVRKVRDGPDQPVRDIPLAVTYDELGHLRGYIDIKGHEKVQTYDYLGRVIHVDDPDSHGTDFGYDAAGNVTSHTDARPKTRRASFDEANRVTAQWDDADPGGTKSTYDYDELPPCDRDKCSNLEGQLARVTYPMQAEPGVDLMGYDTRDETLYLSRTLDGHPFEIRTTRDNLERVAAVAYPGNLDVHYHYDGVGRVDQVPTYVPNVGYGDRGQLESMTYGNGVVTTYGCDDVMRLQSIQAISSTSEAVQDLKYTRDRVGHILTVTDGATRRSPPSWNAGYEYDSLYRLTVARLDPDRAAAETIRIAYDDIDNITSKTSDKGAASRDHVGDYVYGEGNAGPHAVTHAGVVALRYGAAGHLEQRGSDSYEWDFLGRLVHAPSAAAQFAYGASTDRVKKVEGGQTTYYVTPDFEIRDGAAVLYVRVGGERVAKIEAESFAPTMLSDIAPVLLDGKKVVPQPDGLITGADAWIAQAAGAGVFDLMAAAPSSAVDALLAGSVRALLDAPPSGESAKVSYLHQDHLGSAVAVTDPAGAVTERRTNYPYGVSRSAGPPDEVDYSYTGKERDATGLIYFGARYYGSTIGRFVSPDPLQLNANQLLDPQRSNQYAYARDNPLSNFDPDGRDAVAIAFVDYKAKALGIHWPGTGHAGLVTIDSRGHTKYFEYGRYDPAEKGIVRPLAVPSVSMVDGKPTDASLRSLFGSIAKQERYSGTMEGAYFKSTDPQTREMANYLTEREAENSDPDRKPYRTGLFGDANNCATFVRCGLNAANLDTSGTESDYKPSPMIKHLQKNANETITYHVDDQKLDRKAGRE